MRFSASASFLRNKVGVRSKHLTFPSEKLSEQNLRGLLESNYALLVPMASSLATVSGGSCNDAAFRFSRRCSTDEVPGMSRMLGERCSSHAKATVIGLVSKRAATLDSVSDCSGEKPPSGK